MNRIKYRRITVVNQEIRTSILAINKQPLIGAGD
jgi:hypothetical protein